MEEDYVRSFCKTIKVYDTEWTKVRIGNDRDGGYVALKELCAATPKVYSFGVGNDVGFELDWVSRYPEAKVELFDPNIPQLPESHKRFSFHRYGIGHKYKPLTGVEYNSLLKMDIEWEEFGAFQVFPIEELTQFSQLLIEFHLIHMEPHPRLSSYFNQVYGNVCDKINQDLFYSYFWAITFLSNWFAIYHVHANNSLPMIEVNGLRFPPLLELSLVRKDLVKNLRPTQSAFPIAGLDLPNKLDRPDIVNFYPLGAITDAKRERKRDQKEDISALA